MHLTLDRELGGFLHERRQDDFSSRPSVMVSQFCIATRLADALHGNVKKGLFFRGSEPLPFGTAVRPVAELLDYLLTGARAA